MPLMRMKHVPLPDADEQALVQLARKSPFAVKFDNVARRTGQAHITLFVRGVRDGVVARFKRSADAIAYIEAQP